MDIRFISNKQTNKQTIDLPGQLGQTPTTVGAYGLNELSVCEKCVRKQNKKMTVLVKSKAEKSEELHSAVVGT